jgi:hypothetical protein
MRTEEETAALLAHVARLRIFENLNLDTEQRAEGANLVRFDEAHKGSTIFLQDTVLERGIIVLSGVVGVAKTNKWGEILFDRRVAEGGVASEFLSTDVEMMHN